MIRNGLFLLLLIAGKLSAQTTVEFNCDPRGNADIVLLYGAELYQSGVLVKTIDYSFSSVETVDSLKPGNYTLIYTSFFGDTVNQPVTILDTTVQRIELDALYLSESKRNKKLLIDELKNGQSLLIELQTHGCFTMGFDEIEFKRRRGKYLVVFDEEKKFLTEEQVAIVRQFELELRNIPQYSCTTKDSYFLTKGKEEVEFHDRSCRWNGFDQLIKDLGLETDE